MARIALAKAKNPQHNFSLKVKAAQITTQAIPCNSVRMWVWV
jgi:hypothetical protein